MKNKKGFTLVELLAVIVVLGIVSTIVAMSAINIKRKAADDTYNELVKMLEDLGPQIYSHEVLVNSTGEFYTNYKTNGEVVLTTTDLKNAGYIDEIENPYKKDSSCSGNVTITKTNDGPKFEAELNCEGKNNNSESEEEQDDGIELSPVEN